MIEGDAVFGDYTPPPPPPTVVTELPDSNIGNVNYNGTIYQWSNISNMYLTSDQWEQEQEYEGQSGGESSQFS